MMRWIIAGFAAVALLAAATATLYSHSPSTAQAFSSQTNASPVTAGGKSLATEEFEDMTLVYSSAPKR